MKIENFQQCANLVGQIEKHTETLYLLEKQGLTVIINYNEERGRIMTIGLNEDGSEHDYKKYATEFVDLIRQDLKDRISNLKELLLQL